MFDKQLHSSDPAPLWYANAEQGDLTNSTSMNMKSYNRHQQPTILHLISFIRDGVKFCLALSLIFPNKFPSPALSLFHLLFFELILIGYQ